MIIFATSMSNWSEQQKRQGEVKEKNRVRKEKLAGFFFDIAKLTYAGMVIGVVIPLLSDFDNTKSWFAASFGMLLTAASATLANKILK